MRNVFSLKKIAALLFGTVLVIASIYIAPAQHLSPLVHQAEASTTELLGYAWSDTIGWISFNCANTSSCATSNYKVVLDTVTNNLTGYAWSEHVGWIQFGGLTGCPGGGDCDARKQGGELRGWVRVENGDGSGPLPLNGSDGWISLNCANTGTCGTSNFKGLISTTEISGYAWGSEVVGWISFNCADTNDCATSNYRTYFNPPCTVSNTCSADHTQSLHTDAWCGVTITTCSPGYICKDADGLCGYGDPTGSLTVSSNKIRRGATVDVSWSTLYASTCTVSGTNGDSWSPASSSAAVSSAAINSEVTYTLSCQPVGGGTAVVVDTERVSLIPAIKEF
ncbi:MAG: hypothetical protein RLZZ234_373 [Candidatus Parcubacteria bacterium]|jgi:hypothetical protein